MVAFPCVWCPIVREAAVAISQWKLINGQNINYSGLFIRDWHLSIVKCLFHTHFKYVFHLVSYFVLFLPLLLILPFSSYCYISCSCAMQYPAFLGCNIPDYCKDQGGTGVGGMGKTFNKHLLNTKLNMQNKILLIVVFCTCHPCMYNYEQFKTLCKQRETIKNLEKLKSTLLLIFSYVFLLTLVFP